MIRVGVVEDQMLVREGLECLLTLTADIRVTKSASNGREAAGFFFDGDLDVLLLDLRMPEMGGIELLRAVSGSSPSVPCIILTTFDDDASILEGIRLGARGFLMKDVSLTTLSEAIRTAGPQPERLTTRELQILRFMFAGFSNGEIAYALRGSEGTVKNHVSSILGKLGARDRIRAVLKAVEEGYI
jgi:DNA-binding NarL/FixJ family response regulator